MRFCGLLALGLLSVGVLGCESSQGADDVVDTSAPDASPDAGPDASPDAGPDASPGEDTKDAATDSEADGSTDTVTPPACTTLSVSSAELSTDGTFRFFTEALTPALGGAAPDRLQLEFFAPATGTIDLGAGDNANYGSCKQCLRVFEDLSAPGVSARQFFQIAGTLTLAPGSAPQAGALQATLADVKLVEVTIANGGTGASSPVAGGACLVLTSPTVLSTETACVPDCAGKVCGDDGCGGSCGGCDDGAGCSPDGKDCSCVPDCSGKVCGDDGCGGSCGACDDGTACSADGTACVCAPDCAGKVCGDDGCGGQCGTCSGGEACSADGTACTCVPLCSGKVCGGDGCGGSCGTCGEGLGCVNGACTVLGTPCQDAETCGDNATKVCDISSQTCADGQCTQDSDCGVAAICLGQVADPTVGACVDTCEPATSSGCGAGQTCLQFGFDASVGGCFADGPASAGEACTPSDTSAGCVSAHACIGDGPPDGDQQVCRRTCSLYAAAPGCPGSELCHPLGACAKNTPVDPAAIGQTCAAAWSWCGGTGVAITGVCDGDLACRSLCRPGGTDCEGAAVCTPVPEEPIGRCVCTPDCEGKVCGDDGCGGSCGSCADGETCEEGLCEPMVVPCGDLTFQGCCDGDTVRWCENAQAQESSCTAGTCGWSPAGYYDCSTDGETDPSGTHPKSCDGPPPVSFYTQIRPLFQASAAAGGLGCPTCHITQVPSDGGPGGLFLGGYGPGLWQTLVNEPTSDGATPYLINKSGDPAASLLLTNLLATSGEPHPSKPFATADDASYKLVTRWIAEGWTNDSPATVTFTTQVVPLLQKSNADGGLGCGTCHIAGVSAGTAPGGLYLGGTASDLHGMLTTSPPSDGGQTSELYRVNKEGDPGASLLLTNILSGDPESHPVKPLTGTGDARYQTILTWIGEGYLLSGAP